MAEEKEKKSRTEYNMEYRRKYYDVIKFEIPKGKKEYLQKLAANKGVSLRAFVLKGLENYYGISILDKKSQPKNRQ